MSLPRIVGTAQLVELWRVNRQRVAVLTASADFPAGEDLGAGRTVWAYWDVVAWSKHKGREVHPVQGYPDPNEPEPGTDPGIVTAPLWGN